MEGGGRTADKLLFLRRRPEEVGLRFSDRTDTHGGTEALPSYSHSSDVQQCLGAFGVILTRGGWVFFFFLFSWEDTKDAATGM